MLRLNPERSPCRGGEARARPDHGGGDQFLRRRPAHARAADPDRPADPGGDRRPRRGRRAPLRRRRRSRNVRHFWRLRRAPWGGRARRRRLPPEPDLRRARRAVRRGSHRSASASPHRSTATSILSRSPNIGSGRRATSTTFLVVNVERSLGLGILHNGELFRGANGLSPDLGDLMVGPPRNGGGRLADVASETSVLGEAEALMRGGEHDARLSRGTRHGALAAAGRRRRPTLHSARSPRRAKRLGFAIANLITLFAPPKVIISGRAMAASEYFIGPLARDGRRPLAAEPRRRLRHRRPRMERRHLGAGRRGHDIARSLWRALGNHGSCAYSRAAAPDRGRFVMKPVGDRRHRLRQHQLRLSDRGEKIPHPRHRRASPTPTPPRRKRARPNSAFPRAPSMRCSPIRPSRSFSISRSRMRMSRSA